MKAFFTNLIVVAILAAVVSPSFAETPGGVFSIARSAQTPWARDSVVVRVPEQPFFKIGDATDEQGMQYVMFMSAEACTVTVDYTESIERMIERGHFKYFAKVDTLVTSAEYWHADRGCTKARLVLRFVKIHRPCMGACDPFHGHDEYCVANLKEILAIPPTSSFPPVGQFVHALGSRAYLRGCGPCTVNMTVVDKTSRFVGTNYALFSFYSLEGFPDNCNQWYAVIQSAISLDGRGFVCR